MSVRIIQVGMGGFGRSWASEVVPSIEEVELVACVDTDPTSLEKARACTSLPIDRYLSSFDEALESVEADAVLVTSPLSAHIPLALAALSAGKHVLVEKPFAPTLVDAQRAVDAASEQQLVLMVSQNYRFFPAVRAAQKIVANGAYGRLDRIHIDFRRYDNAAPREGHVHYVVPQPMIVDMAIHHFDLMWAVLNREPREIFCRSWNPPWSKYDDPAVAVATITFEDEIRVSYRGSWLSAGALTPWAGEWRMEFAEAEVAWTSHGGTFLSSADSVTVRRIGDAPQPIELPTVTHLSREGCLSAFVRAIETGEEPETSGRNNMRTLALTIAALESAASGSPVVL